MAVLNFTIQEVGSDVVVSGSGSVNTSFLTFQSTEFENAHIYENTASLLVADGDYDVYTQISGPRRFGSGNKDNFANSFSGDSFGFEGQNGRRSVFVPSGYTSNSPLNGVSTYNNKTISANFGFSAVTYTWTYSGGSINLDVILPPTPTPTVTTTQTPTPTPSGP